MEEVVISVFKNDFFIIPKKDCEIIYLKDFGCKKITIDNKSSPVKIEIRRA